MATAYMESWPVDPELGENVLGEAFVLPSQIGNLPPLSPNGPELALVRAVFEIGLKDLWGRKANWRTAARAWLLSEDTEWMYGFTRCCDLLGIDADAARRLIVTRLDSHMSIPLVVSRLGHGATIRMTVVGGKKRGIRYV